MAQDQTLAEKREGPDHCYQCGTPYGVNTQLTDVVRKEVSSQLESQFGDVKDRSQERKSHLEHIGNYSFIGGLAKAGAYFLAANTIAPEGTRLYANICAGLLTIGNMFSRVSIGYSGDFHSNTVLDIRDRVNAFPKKKD